MQENKIEYISEKKSEFEALFKEIFQKNKPYSYSLYNFIRIRLKQFNLNTYEVEDILIEAYIRSIKLIESGRIIDHPEPWLKSVCFNIIREKSRREKKSLNFSELSIDEDSIYDNNSLEAHNLEYTFLVEYLKQLKSEEAEIIKLRVLENLSWKEISRQKHLSDITLRKRGERALKRLREAYISKS